MDWVSIISSLGVITLAATTISLAWRMSRMQDELDHTHVVAHAALTAVVLHAQGADILTRLAGDGTPIRETPEEK